MRKRINTYSPQRTRSITEESNCFPSAPLRFLRGKSRISLLGARGALGGSIEFFRFLSALSAILFIAAVCLISNAQVPPNTPTTIPNEIMLGGPGTTGPDLSKAPTTMVSLDFNNVPIDTVLDAISEKTGYIVVKLSPISGNITLQTSRPVPSRDLPILLNYALKHTGYGALSSGRILKIDTAGPLGLPPVHYGDDPARLDDTDDLATQIIPIKNLDAAKLRQAIAPLLKPSAIVTTAPATSALVVTDSSRNLKHILELVQSLENPPTTAAAAIGNTPPAPTTNPDLAHTRPPTTMLSVNSYYQISDVLDYLSDKAGYTVVRLIPASGRIAFITSSPISSDDLPAIVDTALESDGFGLLPMGRFLIFDTRTILIDAMEIPIHYGGDPSQIADSDNLITQIIPTDTPDKWTSEPTMGNSNIVPNPDGSKSLVITGPSKDVKRFAQIVRDAATQPASSMFVRHLIHADAQAAATQITAMYPPTTAPAGELRVIAGVDERSNNVIVSGPKDKLSAIQMFLDILDNPNPAPTTTPNKNETRN